MAPIAHVFTIRRVAQILGQDEDLLWDLSDQLEPEDGKLWVYDIDGIETPALATAASRPFAESFETSSIQLANRRQLVIPSNPARRGPTGCLHSISILPGLYLSLRPAFPRKCRDLRGRSLRKERCRSAIPHGHWKTTTFTGALRLSGMTAPMVLDGAMNGTAFRAYVEQVLVLTLTSGHVWTPPFVQEEFFEERGAWSRLVGQGNDDQHGWLALKHPRKPRIPVDPFRMAQRTAALAPMSSSRRRVRSPMRDVSPSFCLPPEERCGCVSPSHAAKSRPLLKV